MRPLAVHRKNPFGKSRRGGGHTQNPIPGRLRLPVTWDKHYSVDTKEDLVSKARPPWPNEILQMALVPILGPLDLVSETEWESSLLSL